MIDIEDLKTHPNFLKKDMQNDTEVYDMVNDFINNIGIQNIKTSDDEINSKFKFMCRKHLVHPSKNQIRRIYENQLSNIILNNTFKRWLIKKVARSESGVLVCTIVTKPGDDIKFSCPEKCAYCPTETDLNNKPTQPKSYISTEPAMLRALQYNFTIKGQIDARLQSYMNTGNIIKNNQKKKIEVILSGGTWDVMPKNYRDQVMNELYWAFNIFGEKNERAILSLEEEKKINETSLYGVIGLSIETRPDYINQTTIKQYLNYGVTRVQIGVQHYDDAILKKIERGCTTKDTINAIRLLKMVGLKIVVHLMPDLPGSSKEIDIKMFARAIEDPDLQFDDVKIYPTAVIKTASDTLIVKSKINDWYDDKTYIPYSETNLDDLINACLYYKENVKPWVRIERLVRDIPAKSIKSGYHKKGNLRQMITDKMIKENKKCNCIRCREIKNKIELIPYMKLVVRKYIASKGIEYHITYEAETNYWTLKYILYLFLYYIFALFNRKIYYNGNDKDHSALFGFLRLRIDPTPGGNFIPELQKCGIIREVHVYGMSTEVGNSNSISSQHRGLGMKLIKTAEDIIKSHGLNKSAIIAGIGSREYYKNKCGYYNEGYYMVKKI